MEPEEFAGAWDTEPADALNAVLARDYSDRTFNEPDSDDCLSLIKQVVELRPDIGSPMWELVSELEVEDRRDDDMYRAIVSGWGSAELADSAEGAIARVQLLIAIPGMEDSIGRFLLQQIRRLIESEETIQLAQMRDLAQRVWRERHAAFTTDEGSDPLSFAPLYLNSWPGNLAQYWMSEVDRRWRNNLDSWSGLNEVERAALVGLLEDSSAAGAATIPALAGQLFFLFSADSDFAVQILFPLFRGEATGVLAWNPYLHRPRINNKLLAAGFTEIIIDEWNHLSELGQDDNSRQQFLGLVAWIASFADVTGAERTALVEGSVLADDGRHASDFASAVARLAGEGSVDGSQIFVHRCWRPRTP